MTGFFRCASGLGGQPVMMRCGDASSNGARTMDEYARVQGLASLRAAKGTRHGSQRCVSARRHHVRGIRNLTRLSTG